MKTFGLMVVGAISLAGTFLSAAPASAHGVDFGVTIQAPGYYQYRPPVYQYAQPVYVQPYTYYPRPDYEWQRRQEWERAHEWRERQAWRERHEEWHEHHDRRPEWNDDHRGGGWRHDHDR